MDDIELFKQSLDNIGSVRGQYNWFDVGVYSPLHMLGDASVTFEHCNVSEFI